MKKAIVFLAPGFEEIEALTPVDYLRRAGVEVTTLATGTAQRNVEGSKKITVVADMSLETYVSSSDELPDAVIVPGGIPGSYNVAKSVQALSLIEKMYEENNLICAICAAPAVVLGKTKVLEGKEWTCYPDMQKEAEKYVSAHVENARFVHCQNVITARGAGTAEEFAMEIVKTLCGEETKERLKKATIQR